MMRKNTEKKFTITANKKTGSAFGVLPVLDCQKSRFLRVLQVFKGNLIQQGKVKNYNTALISSEICSDVKRLACNTSATL